MAETIPGGAYKGTDGTWHDANGKPLPAHVVRQLEHGAPAYKPEPDEPLSPPVTPDADVTTETPAETETPAAGSRRTRTSRS